MDAETHRPFYFGCDRPDGIDIAYTQDVSYSDTNFCIPLRPGFIFRLSGIFCAEVGVCHFAFDELAHVHPSDTGNEVEEYTHTVPFALQRNIFIGHHLSSVEEGEAVGVVGITLVGIHLGEHDVWYTSE